MSESSMVTFVHYDAQSTESIIDPIITPLYEATHAEVIDNAFYGAERFADRVRGYVKTPGFELVVAEIDRKPVGLAFGYPLPPTARWWTGVTTPIDPEMISEDGRRTFALCELMVDPSRQRHGVARALHDELLRHRPERRATLLVREDNTPAQRAYDGWGWRKVAKLRPYADAPHFDALILPLRPGDEMTAGPES